MFRVAHGSSTELGRHRDDPLQEFDSLPMVVLVHEFEDLHRIDDRCALHRRPARDGVVARPVGPGRAAGTFRYVEWDGERATAGVELLARAPSPSPSTSTLTTTSTSTIGVVPAANTPA